MGVEEVDQGRDAVEDGAEVGGGDRPVAEGVGVEAPAAQPGAGFEAGGGLGEDGADGADGGQVAAA